MNCDNTNPTSRINWIVHMPQAEISDAIKSFIVQNFLFTDDTSAIQDGDSLIETNVIDSRGILELVFFVEEKFQIQVSDTDIVPENFDSVTSLSRFIIGKNNNG